MRALDDGNRTVLDRGSGVYVHDHDGNRLLDGPGGMWCVNAGHGCEAIIDAITEQLRRLSYASPWELANAPAAELAARLAELSPGDLNRVMFTTGGSTAVDTALRFVGFYNNFLGRPDKKHVISRESAYHGSTYLAASVSGKERDRSWFDFATDFVHHLPLPGDRGVEELEAKILEIGADRVGAFIAEPVMGAAGVIVPPHGYLAGCREVCTRHDVIYISDEVVTAFGRLGHWFASEDVFDFVPDIITTAKGITSGYLPLGAVLISERLLAEFGANTDAERVIFANGFTYSGHPVVCVAALANLSFMESNGLLEHVRDVGPYFQERLRELLDLPLVAEVRGVGLMAAVECSLGGVGADDAVLSQDYEIGRLVNRHCQRLGLLVRPLINTCVMSPPLVIDRAQIDQLVSMLRQGIELATKELTGAGR